LAIASHATIALEPASIARGSHPKERANNVLASSALFYPMLASKIAELTIESLTSESIRFERCHSIIIAFKGSSTWEESCQLMH
jgi:hypothetical protein